jgi:SAM-dependent methyltransferase
LHITAAAEGRLGRRSIEAPIQTLGRIPHANALRYHSLMTFDEQVREYWERPETVSIIDKNLQAIEIETVKKHLLPSDRIADVGCGDGSATVCYADAVRECVGVERSKELRERAQAASVGRRNLTIREGDIMDASSLGSDYDAVITERVLINLAGWKEQQMALLNVYSALRPGGRYLMVENTNEGFARMNDARHAVGLPPVPQHWHNRFFGERELNEFLEGKFQILRHYDFGLYYLLTRVYANKVARFEGWGAQAKKDPVFEKLDAAAREMFEHFGDWLRPPSGAFGPIQCWILRREG